MSKVIKSSSGASSGGNKVNLASASTSSNNKQLPNVSTKTIKSPSNSVSAGAKVDKVRSGNLSPGVIKTGNGFNLENGKTGVVGKPRQTGNSIIGKTTYNAGKDNEASIYTIHRDSDYITSDFYKRITDYFNSGAQNATDSRAFRNEAVIQRNQAFDPAEKEWWDAAIGYLDATVYNEYKGKIDRITASLEGYNTNLTNATNEFRSTQDLLGAPADSLASKISRSLIPGFDEVYKKNQTAASNMKIAQGQVDRANAILSQYKEEMAGYFNDRETFDAETRLTKNEYFDIDENTNIWDADSTAEKVDNKETHAKKAADQARANAHRMEFGLDPKFYNFQDTAEATVKSVAKEAEAGFTGFFAKALDSTKELAKVKDKSFGRTDVPNKYVEKANKWAESSPLFARLNGHRANFEISSIEEGQALINELNTDISDLENQLSVLTNTAKSTGSETGGTFLSTGNSSRSDYNRQRAGIEQQIADKKAELARATYLTKVWSGEKPTISDKLSGMTLDEIVASSDEVSQGLHKDAAQFLTQAKTDKPWYGKLAIDIGVQLGNQLVDNLVGAATGVGPIGSLYARVSGNAYEEGKLRTGDNTRAHAYAEFQGGKEALTELLFGMFDKFNYGKGAFSDWQEELVYKLADDLWGQTFVRSGMNGLGEIFEEGISGLADPFGDLILEGSENWKYYDKLDEKEVLYSMALAFLTTLFGSFGEVATGRNVDQYREYAEDRVSSDIQARQDILQEGQNRLNAVAPPEGSLAQQVIDATRDSGENSQTRQNRIVQMLQDPEQVKLFEQATGKEITGNTIAEKWASVESILSGRTKGETIREETKAKLEERAKKDAPITKAIQKYQKGEDLTRSEISMLYAAGIIDKTERNAMRQLEKADRLVAQSVEKTNDRRDFFIQQAQNNGVKTKADKSSNVPVFEGEARATNDEIEHNQANAPESAVMAPQDAPASGGTDIATTPTESVKPNSNALTRDESRKALENHEADNKQLASVVPIADAAVSAERPVHKINGNLFAKTGEEGELPLSKKVWNWLQQFFVKGEGPNIYSNKLKADVIVNERGLKNDVSHHFGEAKAATFEAIPYVIKNGMTVSKTTDGNGKVRSIIVAGKVYLNDKNGKNGKPVNVYCLLKADDAGQNRFYLHEVSDGKGNLYYQLNNAEKDVSTALQDSTPQMQGSAEETSSVQSVPQTETESNTSTVEQNGATIKGQERSGENGTGQTEIGTASANQSEQGAGGVRQSSRPPRSFEPRGTGENGYVSSRFASRAPRFTGPNEDIDSKLWERVATRIEDDSGGLIPDENELKKLASKAELDFRDEIEKAFGVPVTFYVAGDKTAFGYAVKGYMGVGVFLQLSSPKFAVTAFHEMGHNQWSLRGMGKSRKTVIANAVKQSGADINELKEIALDILYEYGYDEINDGSIASYDDWTNLSDEDRVTMLGNLPEEKRKEAVESLYEEIGNVIISNDYTRIDGYPSIKAAIPAIRQAYVDAGIFTQEEMDSMVKAVKAYESKASNIYFDPNTGYGTTTPSTNDVNIQQDNNSNTERVDIKPSGTVTEHSEGELKKRTQVKGAKAEHEERMADIAKKFGTDDGTFLSYTRDEVSRIAKYCIDKYGMQEEWNRLMGEKNWSRVDFSEAGKIVYEMTMQLNRDMTNGDSGLGPVLERKPGESNKEYFERQKQSDKDAYLARREPIDALLQMYAEQKSEAGQKLQEQHKFTIADEIRMRASQRFLSYTKDGEVNNASDLAKNAKMWNIIDDLLTRAEKADTEGSKNAMMDVTRLVSRIRGRETMWGKLGLKVERSMLNDLYNKGFDPDAMASLMYGSISKIIDDLTPMTYADVIQTVRMNNMLSAPATALNNFFNNANALRVGSLAQNAAYPFAKVFEAITGKKVAFSDKSFFRLDSKVFSKETRSQSKLSAERMAFEYALLSAYYGMDGERGRFDPKNSNTNFWLNGTGVSGFAGRALARYNFLVNALVLSPDAPAKARANLGMQQGIEKAFDGVEMTPEMARNKKELEAYAEVETKRRALQDDNGATRAVLWMKNQINKAHTPGGKTVVGGRQLGELRLGDFAIAFAKVPTNVGIQRAMATPYGAAFQVARYAYGLAEAMHNPEGMDTIKMAKISRDIGRAATTWGMIGLGALGAMSGALKNFDDTDDDEEKKLAAEKGYKGLTFNVSAMLRGGGDWKKDDIVVSGNFLEILAMPLSIGAIMYDAQHEGMGFFKSVSYGTIESFSQLMDAVMEIPGLQQAGQLWESYAANKNTNDKDFYKALKSLGQFAANTSTSYLIPNAVSQVAAGLDNKQRDIYNTTAYGESLKNIWMSKIPGLREKLPEKTDTFGNTRTYGDSDLMAIINTVFLPGDIKKYNVSDLEVEMLRLKKATGYNGTLFDTKAQRKIEVNETEYALNPDQQRAYHMAKAKYLVEAFDKFRTSDVYKKLTDDQRLAVLKMLRMDAERMVKNECLKEAGVEDRVKIDKWEETLTSWDDKIQYLSAKQIASSLWDDENNAVSDFEGMDNFIHGDYKNLTPEMKELIGNSLGYLDDIETASKKNLTSEQWQTGHDIYRYYVDKIDASKTDDEKTTLANETQMWADIQKATGATDKQMEYFEGDMKLWFQNTPNAAQYYEYLKDAGMTRQEAATTIKAIDDLKPQPGYEESEYIQASQRYIAICETVPKDKQWAAFWTIVPSNAAKKKVAMMHDLQAQGVSLRTALSTSGMGEIRGRTETAPGKWKYYTISK